MRHARRNLLLLSFCQAMMLSCNSLMITASTLVGFALAEDKALATLPIALQHLSTMLTSYPASLLMGKLGRRAGFLIACAIGISGGAIATFGVMEGRFWIFCSASVAFGMFTGFGHYYRFTAAEVVESSFKSRAISYVLAGGVIAAFIGPNLANLSQNWITDARFAGSYAAIMGLFALSAIAISLAVLPNTSASPEQSQRSRPLWKVVAQGQYVVAVICAALGYSIMSLVMTATPLAMSHYGHSFSDTAFVIQCHVLGMFVPSFFTGHLIKRFGCTNIMLLGAIAAAACVAINLLGQSITHFWFALVLVGIAWNFLYTGGTTLLTETYGVGEKAKAQGFNDFIVFSSVTVAALSAGILQHTSGWTTVNTGVAPAVAIILLSLLWLKLPGRQTPPAAGSH